MYDFIHLSHLSTFFVQFVESSVLCFLWVDKQTFKKDSTHYLLLSAIEAGDLPGSLKQTHKKPHLSLLKYKSKL